MQFIKYDPSGEIVQVGQVPEESLLQYYGDNCIPFEGDASRAYVRDGVVETYTDAELAVKLARPAGRYQWSNDTMAWVSAETVEDARLRRWAEVKAERGRREYAPISYAGHTFDAHQEGQRQVAGAVQLALLAGPSFTINWTTADNTVAVLDQAGMIGLGVAIGTRTGALYDTARALRAAIDAALTVAEVDAISWP